MALTNVQAELERTVAYLGPRGTNSEEVALLFYGGQPVRFTAFTGINAAIRAVYEKTADECVVPIENSLEGSVNITLDTLAHEVELYITQEIIRPIRHNLLVKNADEPVGVIVSHEQALAQCRKTLADMYPKAAYKAVDSSAEAAYIAAGGAKGTAAIGSRRAAEIYGLKIAAYDVQDSPNNSTRFVVLGRKPRKDLAGGEVKTSLICQIDGRRPGSLCDILQEFAMRQVNLTRIESRPARTGLGVYIFFLDVQGCLNDCNVRSAVEAVEAKSQWFKNLGSYPVSVI